MDKISKALKKFNEKEKQIIQSVLADIKKEKYQQYEVKKLKGYDGVFRIRKGNIRIIFRISNGEVFIVAVERRSDTIYNL